MADQKLRVEILGSAKGLTRSLNTASSKLRSFGSQVSAIGSTLSTRLTLPLGLAAAGAIKFASDTEESLNKVRVAFKDSSKSVEDFANTSLEKFGIAKSSALDMASLFGDMATSMGINTKEAAGLSTSLVGLAGDLASFKNVNIEEVQTALAGVFTGETESLKRMGIVMTEANLQIFAMEKGLKKKVKEMTQAEKVALRYEYIMSKTGNAQGDFARTSDGAANQMRIFQESLKEVAAEFGAVILPLFTDLLESVNDMLKGFKALPLETKKMIVGIAAAIAALGPVLSIIGSIGTALGLLLSPIGLIIAGLVGIAYVIYDNWDSIGPVIVDIINYFIELYNKSEDFRYNLSRIGYGFKSMFSVAGNTIKALWTIIKALAKNTMDQFSAIGTMISGVFSLDKKEIAKGFVDFAKASKAQLDTAFEAAKEAAVKSSVEIAKNVTGAYKEAYLAEPISKVTLKDINQTLEGLIPFADMFKTKVEAPIVSTVDTIIPKLDTKKEKVVEITEEAKIVGNAIQGAFTDVGNTLVQSLGLGESALGSFTATLISSTMDAIGANLASSVAASISAGTAGAMAAGPLAPIVLPALIAGAVAAVKGAFTKVPAFAQGGIVSAPTLAMVGDNFGASQGNPEVIAPLNKLEGMMRTNKVDVGGEFRVQGQDLVMALQRANRERGRII
tara:strand:- start:2951 stop:4972 length:2022 start_codon:yes stop_codon:yes gene_type:complete